MGGMKGANWSVSPPAWPDVLEAPVNCEAMAEARPLGRKDEISLRMVLIVGAASEGPIEAAVPDELTLGKLSVSAGGVPLLEAVPALPVEDCDVGEPTNCDVMADAKSPGRKASMFC